MNDKLFIACVIFFVIDLTLVGTTCLSVILLVKKVLEGKVEIKIGNTTKRFDRDFIELGTPIFEPSKDK